MPDTCLDMTSHFQEFHGDSPICRHSRNIGTNYEHNYEVASGIYTKISYFFDISLNIGRSDIKQKANNSVRSMLLYPFHILFCVTIVFGFSHQPISAGCGILLMDFSWAVGYPFKHPPSATFTRCVQGFKCP